MSESATPRDLVGQKFGRWTVLAYAGLKGIRDRHHWSCRCECGKEKVVNQGRLIYGVTVGCGCHTKPVGGGIVPGERFVNLVTIRHMEQPRGPYSERARGRTGARMAWLCRCDCGNEVFAEPWALRNGVMRNCRARGCMAWSIYP